MNYFKLQIGCMVMVLYVIGTYVRVTVVKKVRCNKIYDLLLFVCPLAIFFDGLTAWTVNHLDTVSPKLNMIFHGCFYISNIVALALLFFFIVDYTVGMPEKLWLKILIHLPAVISILVTLYYLPDIYYVHGKTTNYSMGYSVIVTFLSLFVHFLLFSLIVIIKRKAIERRKLGSLYTFMLMAMMIVVIQIIFPETLITSLLPTLCMIGFYINIMDPAILRLEQTNAEMVTGFATLVENRDNSTGGHIVRTKKYVELILNEMSKSTHFNKDMTRDYIEDVIASAPLHDIGKISTPDSILQKPGKLTVEEYEIMKNHAAAGGDIIKETFAKVDDVDFTKIAYEVARYHHEKWNGKGYPDGLRGEQIPLHARIMAIADVFDAVSAKRCYREALPLDECFKIIEEGIGSDFDPELAWIFLSNREKVTELFYEDDVD